MSQQEGKKETRNERTEESYVIDAAAKVLKVLEALEGRQFEPVSVKRVQQRTNFPYSFCRMALITLKKSGWAKQNVDGTWILGPKAYNQASRLGAAIIAEHAQTAPLRSANCGSEP